MTDKSEGEKITADLARESEFFKTHPREDAKPDWDDLTDVEQQHYNPERYGQEHPAFAEAMRRHARGELYELTKSRVTTFVEGAEWEASRPVEAISPLARELRRMSRMRGLLNPIIGMPEMYRETLRRAAAALAESEKKVSETKPDHTELIAAVRASHEANARAVEAANGDSNDDEIQLLQDALEAALGALDQALEALYITVPETTIEKEQD